MHLFFLSAPLSSACTSIICLHLYSLSAPLSLGKERNNAFQLKQQSFGRNTAGIAGEGMVAADDPMARDKDGNGVGSNGIRYSTNGFRSTQTLGQFRVRNTLPEGDIQQFVPDLLLEAGTCEQQRNIEGLPFSCEELVKFPGRLSDNYGCPVFIFSL